jgi:hypothetical protein
MSLLEMIGLFLFFLGMLALLDTFNLIKSSRVLRMCGILSDS